MGRRLTQERHLKASHLRPVFVAAVCLVATMTVAATERNDRPGILLLAHGGAREWNERVHALVAELNRDRPVELALGMASRAALQSAADRLTERGVTSVVAVPLFVSSHSSVITSTEYLLGLRKVAPPELPIYAKMNHGTGAGAVDHGADGSAPVVLKVPVAMTAALNRHPLVVEMLASRADAISTAPAREAVVIVAHGPTGDAKNRSWLADMAVLAAGVKAKIPFRSVDYLTVRDDAPAPIKDRATAELRALVQRRAAEGSRVLVVPLLLSYGGIEAGIRKRLGGLEYAMATQGLAPDRRLLEWIRQVAAEAALPSR